MLFAGFIVFDIIVARTMIYTMIVDEQTWGTTLTKVFCRGSTDSDCQMKQEKLLLTDFLGRLCFEFYIAYCLWRYQRQRKPMSEETIALTAVNHEQELAKQ